MKKILFVSSEVSPFAKVGGLADVVGSLPKELTKLEVDARVVTGLYHQIKLRRLGAKKIGEMEIPFGGKIYKTGIYRGSLPGSSVPLYLLEQDYWFKRPKGIYGSFKQNKKQEERIVQRFLFLSQASIALLAHINFKADVLHLHDWLTGIVSAIYKLSPLSALKHPKTLLTIHNIAHEGLVSPTVLKQLHIDATQIKTLKRSRSVSVLELGILHADVINTVSPTHAQEITKPLFNKKLAQIIKAKGVSGILNGIDTHSFDPQTDRYLKANYGPRDLTRKLLNKTALQKKLGLSTDPNSLLVGTISRLAEQKGIDLIIQAANRLAGKNFQFVILGQGQRSFHTALARLQKKYPQAIAFLPKFDRHLARQIYAGADVLAMPSYFEPCGLGQMIAMRYGTLPVVRDTGGLHDTVVDFKKQNGRGFVFGPFSAAALIKSLQLARRIYQDKNRWRKLQRQAMRSDFSWKRSAREYIKLYNKILQS